MTRWHSVWVVGVLAAALSAPAAARAEDAAASPAPTPAAEDQAALPAPAEGANGPAQPAEGERPAQPAAVSEAVVRLGRIEMILIQNEDPESAIEFAQAVMEQDGDHPRTRLLIAASYMELGQPETALEHYARAIRQTDRTDPEAHLHALYGLARALQLAGQLEQAAQAYDHYVAYAQQHTELASFVEIAQRVAGVLRARVAATDVRRRR